MLLWEERLNMYSSAQNSVMGRIVIVTGLVPDW